MNSPSRNNILVESIVDVIEQWWIRVIILNSYWFNTSQM